MHPSQPDVRVFRDDIGYTAIYLRATWIDGLTGRRMYKYRSFVPSIQCTGNMRSMPKPSYPDDWKLGVEVELDSVPESVRYTVVSDVLQINYDNAGSDQLNSVLNSR